MRRWIIIILCCAVGLILLLFGAAIVIEKLEEAKKANVTDGDYTFYPVYDGDIMENEEYLGLNRHVSFCANPSGYGLTQAITDENREEFDGSVLFLYEYIQTIIRGDSLAYNKLFNETYYRDNAQKENFAQQMLYNINIRFMSESKEGNERLITYRVEYMIHQNNGTFRRDVGSDASRPQDITVRVGANGEILIERIVTYYSNK